MFALVVLVLVLLFRPSGLLGESSDGARHDRPPRPRRHPGAQGVRSSSRIGRRWDRLPVASRMVLLALLVPRGLVDPATLDRSWQSVLFFPVGIYVLLCPGLNVVVGLRRPLDLGYVAFFAVGAYTHRQAHHRRHPGPRRGR